MALCFVAFSRVREKVSCVSTTDEGVMRVTDQRVPATALTRRAPHGIALSPVSW